MSGKKVVVGTQFGHPPQVTGLLVRALVQMHAQQSGALRLPYAAHTGGLCRDLDTTFEEGVSAGGTGLGDMGKGAALHHGLQRLVFRALNALLQSTYNRIAFASAHGIAALALLLQSCAAEVHAAGMILQRA